jgi:zinc protease
LQWYLGWLADAMVNSFIARKDLDTEMTVVRNEMERGENQPDGVLDSRDDGRDVRLAQLRQEHDRRAQRRRERRHPRLQAFYRQYYQPDNATLIVAGSFDTAAVSAASPRPSASCRSRPEAARSSTRSTRPRTASAASRSGAAAARRC